MNTKMVLTGVVIITVLGVIFILAQKAIIKQPNISTPSEPDQLQKLLAEKWISFMNTPLHFTFMHPVSIDVGSGGGDGYPPETLTSITVSDSMGLLFLLWR